MRKNKLFKLNKLKEIYNKKETEKSTTATHTNKKQKAKSATKSL